MSAKFCRVLNCLGASISNSHALRRRYRLLTSGADGVAPDFVQGKKKMREWGGRQHPLISRGFCHRHMNKHTQGSYLPSQAQA